MRLFIGTHINKVDRKGRISVPAPFRAALEGEPFAGIVAFPSYSLAAIEGFSMSRMEQMQTRLETLDTFSEEQDDLANLIFAEAHSLAFDGEGRITLPDLLAQHAGITEQAAFVGKGATFQIWEPVAYTAYARSARDRLRVKGTTLPAARSASPARDKEGS